MMQTATRHAYFIDDEIDYPETDGQPMAESDFQRKPLTYLIDALTYHFQEEQKVYVSGDLLIYYEKGNPKACVAPDVFVVFNVSKRDRKIYQTWVEGQIPDIVIEITSASTRRKDQHEKPELYQRLGVTEYFQYDPTGDYLYPALQGQRLDEKGDYQKIIAETSKTSIDGPLILTSHCLGLELRLEKGELYIFNPKTQKYLLNYSAEADARRAAEKKAWTEQKRKEWAEHDALIERQRAQQERQWAEQERQRAEQEQEQKKQALLQAEQERQRAEQARQQKEQALQLAEQERQRAEKLAAQLRALGIKL
jgi:Uma2 family endonuclease